MLADEVATDSTGLEISGNLIKRRIKALIARNMWKLEAYYEVINMHDPMIGKAIEVIEDDTFERMKIASK